LFTTIIYQELPMCVFFFIYMLYTDMTW